AVANWGSMRHAPGQRAQEFSESSSCRWQTPWRRWVPVALAGFFVFFGLVRGTASLTQYCVVCEDGYSQNQKRDSYRDEGATPCLPDSHAATAKQTVITTDKTIGRINKYLQLTTVIAAKQRANAQAVPRTSASVGAGRLPSCHASIAANM